MTMDNLLPWITVILAGFTAISFFDAKRKLNMDEGARMEKQKVQNDEIKSLKDKVVLLETARNVSEKDVSEIKLTLKYMAEAISRIENKVDTLAPPTILHHKKNLQEE